VKLETCNLKLVFKQSGFTLLEILVVVFLIVLTVGVVSLNFRHDTSQLVEQEAKRFAALVEQMCQESLVQGRVFAIDVEAGRGYRFVVLEGAEWREVPDDDILRTRTLAADMDMQLAIDDVTDSTRLRCEPDGFMTPFTADFDLEGERYRVASNESRKIIISPVD
jgi:general secretion pathway protein H